MKVVALRGVCIGSEQHLLPGEEADVDKATAQFLVSIGAVQEVPSDAAPAAAAPARGRKRRDAAPEATATNPEPDGAEAPQQEGV
jgi:hypothetical protein